MSSAPNWDSILESWWGPGTDDGDFFPLIAAATNVVVGSNPPFTVQDFFGLYPKFGGATLTPIPSGTATQGSPTLTGVTNLTGVAAGNPIADSAGAFPDGTTVTAVGSNTITLSSNATKTGTTSLTVWNATLIPLPFLYAYIALASASLVQARWQDTWYVAMGLYVAHFATLWARADGNPNSTLGQIAAQGIANGIQVSKSVGDVSVSYQPVPGLEMWAAWNLTSYGQLLATFAMAVGAGPILVL
jgi:hypothetical protein